LPPPAALVSVDDVARGKPAPDPYLLAAEMLGTTARRCLVIEDAPAGITAAKAAGALVVAVSTTHAATALQEADAVINGLQDVTIEADQARLRASWLPLPPARG
ncbi:MAG: HAD family hydrolase, partial [Chloroflexota bacterium]